MFYVFLNKRIRRFAPRSLYTLCVHVLAQTHTGMLFAACEQHAHLLAVAQKAVVEPVNQRESDKTACL